jgi:tetratricopeptide (TPR) repeat protein
MNRLSSIFLAQLLIGFLLCGELRGDALKIANAALTDRLYHVAELNAVRALNDPQTEDRLRALEILLEALARQKRYSEMLRALESHSEIVVASPQNESLLYWRVLALFNEERFDDVSNIVNSGRVGTNTVFGITTLRIGARTRDLNGDLPGAVDLFRTVDAATTNLAIRCANALEWAVLLDKRSRYDDALEVLRRLSRMETNNDSVNEGALLRGRILMRLGRVEEAARIMDALAMNERAAEIPRVQALVEMSVYRWEAARTNEAIAYARSACERAQLPETRRVAGYRLGDLLCHSRDTIKEAAGIIKALVREFPDHDDSMRAHLKLADSFLQLNMPEEAAAEYRIFLETYPSSALDSRVMQGRGWALFQLRRFTEAGVAFERAAELSTDAEERAESLFKRCDALLAEGRYAEAALAYEGVNRRFPDTALAGRALYLSAEALERDGRLPEARSRYVETAERYPRRDVASDALLRTAAIQAAGKELDGAVETYTRVIRDFTNSTAVAAAYTGRGRVYYSQYRFENAMQDFAAVAEVAPDRVGEARYYLILCLYGLGRDADALESAEKYVTDFPASPLFPDMLLWLGKFHFNRGDYSSAGKYFADYATGFADRQWADAAVLWQARAMFNRGDYTAVIETVTRLVTRYPSSSRISEARFIQAQALTELARFDAAILLFDRILESDAQSRWGKMALLHKGNCLFALGAGNPVRFEEALAVYRSIALDADLTSSALIEIHYKIGRCLEKLERYEEAVDAYYSQVLLRYIRDRAAGTWHDETTLSLVVRASFSAAEIYEKQGRYEQAEGVLERIVKSGSAAADEARRRIAVLKKLRKN